MAGEWWRGASIYQVYPRSFQDSSGDGVGDLRGILDRFGHIAALGVDAIWISPFFTSPMADMGYDVSDYRGVDPLFGTLADFDALVAVAHDAGIRVLIDQVISHSSDQHPWFGESRASRTGDKADWYVWADPKPDGTAPNNWLSIFGGPAWEWDGVRRQYYLHNFLISQPDLNLHSVAVQDALLEEMRFWLERGVDGFRLDTVNYYFHDPELRDNPPATAGSNEFPDVNPYGFQEHLYDKTRPENVPFLKRLRALLDEYDAVAVGEVGDGERSPQTVGEYTAGADLLQMCYTFDLLGPDFTPGHIRASFAKFHVALERGWVCWAFSNHDVVRQLTRWLQPGDDPAQLAKLCIALLVSLRGAICLYQGEELGLQEAELRFEDLRDPYGIRFWPAFKGRDGCRTPMPWERDAPNAGFSTGTPWLPIPAEHKALAADGQDADDGSVLASYRAALAFRRAHPALTEGTMRFLDAPAGVLAFEREGGGERLLCVFNLSREPVRYQGRTLAPLAWSIDAVTEERVTHLTS